MQGRKQSHASLPCLVVVGSWIYQAVNPEEASG